MYHTWCRSDSVDHVVHQRDSDAKGPRRGPTPGRFDQTAAASCACFLVGWANRSPRVRNSAISGALISG